MAGPMMPSLAPRVIDPLWFTVDKPCDDAELQSKLESEYHQWVSYLGHRLMSKTWLELFFLSLIPERCFFLPVLVHLNFNFFIARLLYTKITIFNVINIVQMTIFSSDLKKNYIWGNLEIFVIQFKSHPPKKASCRWKKSWTCVYLLNEVPYRRSA